MGKAETFIKFQRSLVQKAETVIDFETAGTSFYVSSIAFTSVRLVVKQIQHFLEKIGFQHSRFLGFTMLEFFVLHSHTVGERVLRHPFRARDNIICFAVKAPARVHTAALKAQGCSHLWSTVLSLLREV